MLRKGIFIVLFLYCPFAMVSQNLDLNKLGKEKFIRYQGGIAASGVYYSGAANRNPFSYYLRGNLNFTIAGLYNIPLSFSYSNQQLNFPSPFNFNRLSLHPSYKWVTAHIGDVSMNFSPYTLSGHQFTGAGVDLAPEGKLKFSAMYGRLLKATEYTETDPNALVAYKRIGMGMKLGYDFKIAQLEYIFFHAKDDATSLKIPVPLERGLQPKENLVMSLKTQIKPFDKGSFDIEFALSGITEDTNLKHTNSSSGAFGFILNENESTQYYKAFKVNFSYPVGSGSVGAGYERIDPNYKTLGAYYFNNDLENITVNASQSIFNKKLQIGFNGGFQRDNLNKEKKTDMSRIVSAVNLNYQATDQLSFNGAFSNFQSFTNIRDQFDYINQTEPLQHIDTLNYRQINTTANFGTAYQFKKNKKRKQSINLNLLYQRGANEQGGKLQEEALSQLYNAAAGYSLQLPEKQWTFGLQANASYNTVGQSKSTIFGPSFTAAKPFLDKKLRTNFSAAYNRSIPESGHANSVMNFRFGANYALLKKHLFNLSAMSQFRSGATTNQDITITLGYNYTFDNIRIKFKKQEQKEKEEKLAILRFRFREVTFKGSISEVSNQVQNLRTSSRFNDLPNFKKDELTILWAHLKEEKKDHKVYKERAIIYLKSLYSYSDYLDVYYKTIFDLIKKLQEDMRFIDSRLENAYIQKKAALDALIAKKPSSSKISILEKQVTERRQKLLGHRWMVPTFAKYKKREDVKKASSYLAEFERRTALKGYKEYEKNKNLEAISLYLETRFIDFYYKKSLNYTKNIELELRNLQKQ